MLHIPIVDFFRNSIRLPKLLILAVKASCARCLLTIFLCLTQGAFAQYDLKQFLRTTPLVTKTKRIVLDGFPLAHNPSIIEFEDGYLLSFRYMPNMYAQPWTSYIGVVLLDKNWEVSSPPQLLHTRSKLSKTPSQSEDARLFSYLGKIFLIYNDNIDVPCPGYGDRRDMFMAEVLWRPKPSLYDSSNIESSEEREFYLSTPLKLIHAQKYSQVFWQKNWVPFEWQDKLWITYSVNPHEILYPNLLNGYCYSCYESPAQISWNLGILRCSAPPILVDGEYLSFFHSGHILSSEFSGGSEQWHYFMGAYTFSPNPPFAITSYTPDPILVDEFYEPSHYWKKVVFPGGFVVDGPHIYLAYGKDDSEIWIATIDKQALKDVLVPVGQQKDFISP